MNKTHKLNNRENL